MRAGLGFRSDVPKLRTGQIVPNGKMHRIKGRNAATRFFRESLFAFFDVVRVARSVMESSKKPKKLGGGGEKIKGQRIGKVSSPPQILI